MYYSYTCQTGKHDPSCGSASIVSYPPVEALVLHQFKLLILGLAQEFTATVEITQNDSSVCTKVTSCTSEARQADS